MAIEIIDCTFDPLVGEVARLRNGATTIREFRQWFWTEAFDQDREGSPTWEAVMHTLSEPGSDEGLIARISEEVAVWL